MITKGYKQEGKSAKLHWTIKLNWGQSELSDVVITDIVGQDAQENPNQMIYKDSFKIYEMKFTGSNNTPTRVEPGYSPGTIGDGLYYVTFDDPDSTFKIVFNEPITKAYTVEYDSYFLGASGDKLENQAKLTYKSKVTNNGEDEGNSSNASFTFTGGASAEKGQLEITKVDKDDPIKKLSGAVFELWSAKTGGFLIERVSTDNDGVYTFTTKVGRTDYYLIETKAPEGYSLDESPYKNLTKVTIGQPLQPLTVTNTKLVRAVTLKKVDKDDKSPLAGAQFKLYDANTHKQVEVKDTAGNIVPQPFETNEFGEITVGNLAPGTYYFEETAAPHHYLLPVEAARKTAEFTITDNQIKVIQVEMKNTRGIGKIIIKKVDGANNSPLKDVVFNLVKKFNDGSQVMTATTNEDGIAEFRDLPYDTYILTEEKPHSGYALLTPQEVALDGEQDAVELVLTIKNNKKDHSVKLTKYNANKTLTLKGAVFELRKETNGVYEVVPGITAEQLTTDDNGALCLKDLPAGKYHLIETKAPAGYRLNSDPVAFEIEENQIAAIQLEKTNSRISSGGGGGGGVNPSDPKDPGDTDKPKDPDPKQPQEPEDPAGPSTPGTPPGGGNESGGGGNPSEDFGINEGLPLGDTNANKTLPKTGENSYLPFYLLGFALLILGAGIGRKRV
ncbi:Gram-positive anchor [Syntrophomonas zehnderi OL-4]|uniref:Gram-positive anchor n=1 Tax=Syntrophomonas zehnderi OL-4 TaxID=690567 RepID=A0A0E4C992_9FIRM|nr:SpaA isopeptide-forming pilin-related protein [Syntrophomonas zehnderi]CFX88719.1 Gram-positive anchor [Syntrophomonas zehnderi OL-4]